MPHQQASVTTRAAWQTLEEHYEDVGEIELRQLFADDPKRGYVRAYDERTPGWARLQRRGGRSTPPARGSPARSSGPASTTAASRSRTNGPARHRISA